jgi:hypothetical protein
MMPGVEGMLLLLLLMLLLMLLLLLVSCIRQHTSAYVSIRQYTSAYVSIRQHTSAYVSIRQHTSAYVSMRDRGPSAPRASASTVAVAVAVGVYRLSAHGVSSKSGTVSSKVGTCWLLPAVRIRRQPVYLLS